MNLKQPLVIILIFLLLGSKNSPALSQNHECNVRLLVCYTEGAATAAGSYNIMKDSISNAVANINTSFTNSGIRHEVMLAGILRLTTDFATTGDYDATLSSLEASNEVQTLRTRYRADVVALIINDNSRCGLPDNTLGASHAFLVVNFACMNNNWSLARELGYLYQCGNLDDEGGSPDDFYSNYDNAYAYEYLGDDDEYDFTFTTIMGFEDDERSDIYDGYDLILYWSNPDVSYQGEATGDDDHSNAEVIKTTGSTLANYVTMSAIDTLSTDTINAYEYGRGIARDSLLIDTVTVAANGSLYAEASQLIHLKPGFHAKEGSTVTLKPNSDLLTCTFPDNGTASMTTKPVRAGTKVHVPPATVTPVPATVEDPQTVWVYPNPFSGNVIISYSLAQPQKVSLAIFDTYGRELTELLAHELQQSGRHEVVWKSGSAAQGTYFYRLVRGSDLKTGKVIKIYK